MEIHAAVDAGITDLAEPDACTCGDNLAYTPPGGNEIECRRNVLRIGCEPHPVEDSGVDRLLTWQPDEGVRCRLDLPASEMAVDRREVDSCLSLAKPQFGKDQRVRSVTLGESRGQGRHHLSLAHGHILHCYTAVRRERHGIPCAEQ